MKKSAIKNLQIACVAVVVGAGVIVGSVFGVKYSKSLKVEDSTAESSVVSFVPEENYEGDVDTPDADTPENEANTPEENPETPENSDGESENLPVTSSKPAEARPIYEDKVKAMINDLASVGFSENGSFNSGDPDKFELVKFCFCIQRRDNSDKISKRTIDGRQMLGVDANTVDEIAEKYFGISPLEREKISSGNPNLYFIYDEGFFYMPGASGARTDNYTKITNTTADGDELTVRFEIYDGDDEYISSGSAVFDISTDEYKIKQYVSAS